MIGEKNMSDSVIKFIFFDLGNVLVRFSNGILFQRVGDLLGEDPDWIARNLFNLEITERIEEGRFPEEEYYAFLGEEVSRLRESRGELPGEIPEKSVLLDAACRIFWLNEPMQPVLQALAEIDFPRGILSNVGPWHWEFCCREFPILMEWIPENRITSYRVGIMKPHRGIYDYAFQCARETVPDLEPSQVLFIDDLPRNIEGAKEFGFQGFVYSHQSHRELVDRLTQRNILNP